MLRLAVVLAVACVGFIAGPAAAQADDLIQLNGDPPVTLSGGLGYGLLFLDGTVRLAGDTAIQATDVFIGPDAQIQTCFDPSNTCVNGRSLTITASGGVAISPAIDLRGTTGTNRAGGSLVIRAARVSLGGAIETAGILAPSGSITIDSPGLVVTQGLHSPGAGIFVHGAGGVVIGGDVSSAGTDTATGSDPSRVTSGASVDLASGAGDVNVLGSISSFGRDVPAAGAIEGGNAGPVTVVGGDVHISGGISARAGRGIDGSAGASAPIALVARGALTISGTADASGGVSTSGYGTAGSPVRMTAGGALSAGLIASQGGASTNVAAGGGGPVTLSAVGALSAGSISSIGAGSPQAGVAGGPVSVTGGGAVALGAVTTDAGDASSDPANGSGQAAGTVTIKATGAAGTGAISARGGSGRVLGGGGAGGSIYVSGDRISTASITALGENLSAPGGSVVLVSQNALLIGGPVDTSGAAGANGNLGGVAGSMLLIAAHGALTLGGRLRSEGGTGATAAGGGNGGAVEIAAQSISSSAGVLAGGGNGGNAAVQNGPRGFGGNGGRVRVWTQLPSLILLQLVDTTGGTGDPNGTDGLQQEESAPTTLSIVAKTSTLSFTTHSPEAEGYRIFASLAGAPAKALMATKTGSAVLPKVAPCVNADYTVTAYQSAVGWESAPIGPVSFMAPPSATQACTDAPQLTFGVQKLKKKIKALKKKKWKVPVRFLADGMGNAHVVLSHKKKVVLAVDKPLAATRREVTVTLTIPKKLRKAGKFTVTVTGTAPIGKARSKSTLALEVKK